MPSSGIFATSALRNRSGPPRAPPAFGGAPSDAALRASGAPPAGWPRRGRLRRSEGPSRASEGYPGRRRGPRRSGGLRVSLRSPPGRLPGPRCSSRRALRRSRFRCPSGFPFSLSPCRTSILPGPGPPCQAPSGVFSVTFPGAIRHGNLPARTLRHRSLHTGNLRRRRSRLHLRSRNLPRGNLHLRSSNLRLRR